MPALEEATLFGSLSIFFCDAIEFKIETGVWMASLCCGLCASVYVYVVVNACAWQHFFLFRFLWFGNMTMSYYWCLITMFF